MWFKKRLEQNEEAIRYLRDKVKGLEDEIQKNKEIMDRRIEKMSSTMDWKTMMYLPIEGRENLREGNDEEIRLVLKALMKHLGLKPRIVEKDQTIVYGLEKKEKE